MRLNSYKEFLLESILLTSNKLSDIIKSIDDPIAKKFSSLINSDIKTKFNILDVTDSNGTLSFITDIQTNNKIQAGSKPEDLFSDKNNQSTIGRVVRGILSDNNISFTDYEIEKFVNKFKAAYDLSKLEKSKFKVVKGEDIRYWYDQKNYCEETLNGKGSLGKSCMRYKKCSSYFDIYVNNPEVSMVIYLDESNKLRARSILWQTETGLLLDRIYYTDDSDVELVKNWANDNLDMSVNLKGKDYRRTIKLTGKSNSDGSYDEYPYMDQFMYYYTSEKRLYNYEPSVEDRKNLFELQDTTGSAHCMDEIYCEYEDTYYSSNEVVYSEYLNSYIHRENAVFSEYMNSQIWRESAVYSNLVNSYINSDDAIEFYLDENKNKKDFCPYDMVGNGELYFDKVENSHFLTSLAVECGGELCLPKNIIKVFKILPESIDQYKELYNIIGDDDFMEYANILDSKLFNIGVDPNDSIEIANINFFRSNYKFLIMDKLDDILEKLRDDGYKYKFANQKEDEITRVDELLDSDDSVIGKAFKYRNIIYKFGISEVDKIWTDFVLDHIDEVLLYIDRVRGNFKSIYKKYDDVKEKIKKLLYFIIIENIKDFYSEFGISYENKWKKFLSNDYDSVVKSQILSLFDVYDIADVRHIISLSISRIYSIGKYQTWKSTRWMTMYLFYLENQSLFDDIIKTK